MDADALIVGWRGLSLEIGERLGRPVVDARRVRNVEEQDRLSGRCSDSIGKCGDLIVVPRSHHLTHGARNYPERSFFVELGYDLGYSTVKAPR